MVIQRPLLAWATGTACWITIAGAAGYALIPFLPEMENRYNQRYFEIVCFAFLPATFLMLFLAFFLSQRRIIWYLHEGVLIKKRDNAEVEIQRLNLREVSKCRLGRTPPMIGRYWYVRIVMRGPNDEASRFRRWANKKNTYIIGPLKKRERDILLSAISHQTAE